MQVAWPRRGAGLVLSAALALTVLAAAPRPGAAISTCLTGYYCSSLSVVGMLTKDGTGTVKTDDGLIDCTVTGGSLLSGTCSSAYVWKQTLGAILPVTYTETPATGSMACPSTGCLGVGQPYSSFIDVWANVPQTLTVDFEQFTYQLQYSSSDMSMGVVAYNKTNCIFSPCVANVVPGTQVSLKAIPNTGFVFAYWELACASFNPSPTCSLTINSNLVTVAHFAVQPPPTQTPLPTSTPSLTSRPSTSPTSRPPGASSAPGAPTPAPASSGSVAPTVASGEPPAPTQGSDATTRDGAATPAPLASGGAAPVSATSGSDSVPWIAIIVIVGLVVVGANVALFQVLRRRQP